MPGFATGPNATTGGDAGAAMLSGVVSTGDGAATTVPMEAVIDYVRIQCSPDNRFNGINAMHFAYYLWD